MIRLAALVVVALLLTACSTSKDAVQTGQEFTFVAAQVQTFQAPVKASGAKL